MTSETNALLLARQNEKISFKQLQEIALLLGVLDSCIEMRLRNCFSPSICCLYSFGIETNGKAYATIGASGAGKTTLGLACCTSHIFETCKKRCLSRG